MAGIGLIMGSIGYSIIYWGIKAIQGEKQQPFMRYIFPFGK